ILERGGGGVGGGREIRRDLGGPVGAETSATSLGGTPTALATSRMRAVLASPSAGAARTRTMSAGRPSASTCTPSMASQPPLGVNRTASAAPPVARAQGLAPGIAAID